VAEQAQLIRRAGRWALVLFTLGGAVLVAALFAENGSLDEADIETYVADLGVSAPVGFIFIFTLFGSLLVPTTLLAIVGAAIFGGLLGFGYSMVGAFFAAIVGFLAARTVGRGPASRWLERSQGRLAGLDKRLDKHGFTTALFMRLLYIPNGLINVTCGISSMRTSSYALASLIGILPMVFAVSFMTIGIREMVNTGDWSGFATPGSIGAIGLFLVCLSIPFVTGAMGRGKGGP
jgi:uncharacterized membrane protein YdjX (TVP38/TMEM64 family)